MYLNTQQLPSIHKKIESKRVKDILIDQADLPGMVKIAEIAARQAGDYLLKKLGTATVTAHKSPLDDLLDADLEAERLILTRLREESPELGILSEESGHEGSNTCFWLVDPLDGSANFQHGSPLFATSIALVNHRTTYCGVIYLPTRDEMFTAIQGQGAFLNGTRIGVSSISTLEEAIVHVGDFAKDNHIRETQERLKDIFKLATNVRRTRMVGTAATDLAYVACGRADLLLNHATHPWDVEAGKLLIVEAGGKVSTWQAHSDTTLTIYSNGIIHQMAESILLSSGS